MPNVEPQKEREELLVRQIEELVFETLYSPVDLSALLETADGRGRIRRVSPAHLYYGLQKLEDSEITTLLPHITQEQWTGVLDLDLWSKDEMSTGAFLHLEGFIAGADDPVARKLIRAADSELWSLLFKRRLQIHQRIEEAEFEGAPEEGEWLETPDRAFRLILPEDPEESRLLRALVSRLFGLDPELATILLLEAQARTSVELEEEGYQNRKRRIERAGFQDYFESFEIYSVLSPDDPLPEKKRESIVRALHAAHPQGWPGLGTTASVSGHLIHRRPFRPSTGPGGVLFRVQQGALGRSGIAGRSRTSQDIHPKDAHRDQPWTRLVVGGQPPESLRRVASILPSVLLPAWT